MTGKFKDKVVLITGAAGGMGAATMRAFAAQGARLVASDLAGAKLDTIVEEVRSMGAQAIAVPADVSVEAEVKHVVDAAVDRFGRLDIAFNNAGIHLINTTIPDTTEAQWDKVLDISLKGVFLFMKHEIPAMLANGGGAIVNTSSGAGLVGVPGAGAYVAAKHGVIGLTKSAALEYSGQGIRINAICPTATNTPMLADWFEHDFDGKMLQAVVSRHPIGRIADPSEIASTVLFLASNEASFITGAILPVDGGATVG